MSHNSPDDRMTGRTLPDHTIITVRGDLDIATTAALRNRILTTLLDTTASVIIDLSGVSFCDTSGLALLVGTQRRANHQGVTISLAAPRPQTAKLLRMTGLDRAFTIHPTVTSARLDHPCAGDRAAV